MPTDATEEWWERWNALERIPRTLAQSIVFAVLADMGGRRGIKWELEGVGCDVVPELLSELTSVVDKVLEAELRTLRADKERLDWWLNASGTDGGVAVCVYSAERAVVWDRRGTAVKLGVGKDGRAAIDAAWKGE